MKLAPEELTALVTYQVGALKGFLDAEGVPLHHVKPHGVLYGMPYPLPPTYLPNQTESESDRLMPIGS